MFPKQYVQVLESYITDRFYRVKQTKAGVPQGNVLNYVLYLPFTYDIPKKINIKIATFADDTNVLAIGANADEAIEKL